MTKVLEGCDGFIKYQQKRTATLAAEAKTFYRLVLHLRDHRRYPERRHRRRHRSYPRQKHRGARQPDHLRNQAPVRGQSQTRDPRRQEGRVRRAGGDHKGHGGEMARHHREREAGIGQRRLRRHPAFGKRRTDVARGKPAGGKGPSGGDRIRRDVADRRGHRAKCLEHRSNRRTGGGDRERRRHNRGGGSQGSEGDRLHGRRIGRPHHFSIGALQEDRRHHRHHQRDRGPDEPPRPERSHRGGPGRGAREGVRRRRRRGEETRREDHRGYLRGERHYHGKSRTT